MKYVFEVKRKPSFIIFKVLSFAKNCLRPKNPSLSFIIRFTVEMFKQDDSLSRQKMNSCLFQQILQQNVSWFLS